MNEPVYVKNTKLKIWEKGKIMKIISHFTYLVQINNNIKFVHANDIRVNPYQIITEKSICDLGEQPNVPKLINSDTTTKLDFENNSVTNTKDNTKPIHTEIPTNKEMIEGSNHTNSDIMPENPADKKPSTPKAYITRSGRVTKPPIKLNL